MGSKVRRLADTISDTTGTGPNAVVPIAGVCANNQHFQLIAT